MNSPSKKDSPSWIVGEAHPRVGLLGNPSDGYRGKVLAATFRNFVASVALVPHADRIVFGHEVFPRDADVVRKAVEANYLKGGDALLAAAWLSWFESVDLAEVPGCHLSFETSIPRQVGFSGSSAIVIATLRALCQTPSPTISPTSTEDISSSLAEMATDAEQKKLGIAGGPQDRVIQSLEGLWLMDFSRKQSDAYHSFDPRLLPPSFVAWDPEPGESSGVIHQDLRERFESGDSEVVQRLSELAQIAEQGTQSLEDKDTEGFSRLVNRNFEIRQQIMNLRDRDVKLVEIGREFGAAVKFAGSGGAAYGVLPDSDPSTIDRIAARYREEGFFFGRPDWTPRKGNLGERLRGDSL